MTEFVFGMFVGYVACSWLLNDWEKVIKRDEQEDEWIEVIPDRQYRKRRRYS